MAELTTVTLRMPLRRIKAVMAVYVLLKTAVRMRVLSVNRASMWGEAWAGGFASWIAKGVKVDYGP